MSGFRSGGTPSVARVATFLALGASALGYSSSVLAFPATTAPGKAILVEVNITNKGLRTAMLTKSTDNGVTSYVAAYSARRGQIAYFVIRNRSGKPQSFVVLGHRTKTIRPGKQASIHFPILLRGVLRFESMPNKGTKGFSGTIVVT